MWYWYRHDKLMPPEVFGQLHRSEFRDDDVIMAASDGGGGGGGSGGGGAQGSRGPMRCVQRPGEVLYLPRSFPHSTRNVGKGILVSIGAQFGRTNDKRHLGSTHKDGPGSAQCDAGPMCDVKVIFQRLVNYQKEVQNKNNADEQPTAFAPVDVERVERILAVQPFAFLEDASASGLHAALLHGGHAELAERFLDTMIRVGRDDEDGGCPHLRAAALYSAAEVCAKKDETALAQELLREAARLSPKSTRYRIAEAKAP